MLDHFGDIFETFTRGEDPDIVRIWIIKYWY